MLLSNKIRINAKALFYSLISCTVDLVNIVLLTKKTKLGADFCKICQMRPHVIM